MTSPSELEPSFTAGSDREGDDKVPDATGRGFVLFSRRANPTSMQLPSLTELRNRFRDRVDSSARGTDVPAGIDRGADAVAPSSARARGRMRRRLRELQRLREAQLLELGALMLEAHKHGRDDSPAHPRPGLVCSGASSTTGSARAAAATLGAVARFA